MVIERIKRNNPWKTLAKCLPHNKCSALIKMNLRAHTETLLLLFISRQKYSKNYINYYSWPKENKSMQKLILVSAQGRPQIRLLASHAAHAWGRQLG